MKWSTVLNIAEEQIGYLEKKSLADLDDKTANAGKNNYTKYARDLDSLGFFNGKKNGYPWCAVIVCWYFYKACGSVADAQAALHIPAKSLAASTTYFKKYFTSANRISSTPHVGDVVFFGTKHTGLVVAVNGKGFETIEGNTSSGDDTVIENGGGVFRKKYSTVKSTYSFGRPTYEAETATTTTSNTGTKTTTTTLKQGDSGDAVKQLQTKLIYLGFSCGSKGADGSFGANTLTAVKKFQTAYDLTVDGKAGPATQNALNTAYKNAVLYIVTAAGGLNVRKGASTSTSIVKVLSKNASVIITEVEGKWGRLSDHSGWVSTNYLKKG